MPREAKTRWYIRNCQGKFLTVGALHSRDSVLYWCPDKSTAEAFDERSHARDFALWAVSHIGDTFNLIDYDAGPPVYTPEPPQPVRSKSDIIAAAMEEEKERAAIRRRKAWGVVNHA